MRLTDQSKPRMRLTDLSQEESEPFIDVSVGGQELAGVRAGELLVWAVTVGGRVVVRQGVTR